MKELNKQKPRGRDEISNLISNECAEELCELLEIVFQSRIEQGKLPNVWKKVNIIPL